MNGFDAVGFGALNLDKLYCVNKIAGEEEESFIVSFNESCGGSAANTMVGLSRLGLKTGFIGKVSQDREGKLLLLDFKKEGVDTNGIIVSKDGKSGIVLGFVDPDGQRALYVDPGVNDLIESNEVKIEYIKNCKVLHLTSFVGESIKAQKDLINEISEDIIISLDPGRIYAERGVDYIKDILERTNIILLNEGELKFLTRKEYTYVEGVKTLLEYGISVVALKLGDKGCYVTNGKESYLIKPFRVKSIDTTGAGDAFNAGFLYGFIKGRKLKECGRFGNFVASCCIKEFGARSGLPEISKLNLLEKVDQNSFK